MSSERVVVFLTCQGTQPRPAAFGGLPVLHPWIVLSVFWPGFGGFCYWVCIEGPQEDPRMIPRKTLYGF